MKKWCVLLLSILLLLAACGQKYNKEIDEVTKLEKQSVDETKDSNDRDIKRKNSDFYVYEEGKVIVISYNPFKDSDYKTNSLYKIDETKEKYKQDLNIHVKKYMKENKPDYKEENFKK